MFLSFLFICAVFGYTEWKMYAENSDSPNFLFITIDTLRKDRFGCYGSVVPNTPNIDAIARNGVVFDNYFSAANCTIPSHLAMLSSKLPTTLNIVNNERYDVASRTKILPMYLHDLGYKNYGVASVFFLGKDWLTHFGSTFDYFVSPEAGEFKASEVTAQFQKLLPEFKKQKFFCWLHFFDPHVPYDPPQEYRNYYASLGKGGIRVPTLSEAAYDGWLKPLGLTQTWEVRARYRGEVAYTDAQVGAVLDLLKQNSLDQNTIVFIVADHGESLGDRGLFYTHAGLYEPTIHVPFIAYGKNFKPGHVSEFTSGIDLAPTILELAGGKLSDDFDGLSAVPFLMGKNPNRDRLIYSISAENTSIAVLKAPYKLIYNREDDEFPKSLQLFQILRDRYERQDRSKSDPKVVDELLNRANPYILGSEPVEIKKSFMSEEDKEKLQSLGYLQ